MNVKEIIESGSLELYVMGALPQDEIRQIDELRRTHKDLNDEILRIEEAMIAYAEAHAVQPKEQLKDKIAAQLNIAAANSESAEAAVIQMLPYYRYAVAASVALIVMFASTTFYFYTKYNETSKQLLALQSENVQLANQAKYVTTEAERIKSELAVVSDPANKPVTLKGLPISPSSKAMVYWDKEKGTLYINSSSLPQVASNEQFQLWAIVDGKPVDLGVINKDSTFSQMKDVLNAQAFAITLEPLGGKPAPTLDKMYVMGAI